MFRILLIILITALSCDLAYANDDEGAIIDDSDSSNDCSPEDNSSIRFCDQSSEITIITPENRTSSNTYNYGVTHADPSGVQKRMSQFSLYAGHSVKAWLGMRKKPKYADYIKGKIDRVVRSGISTHKRDGCLVYGPFMKIEAERDEPFNLSLTVRFDLDIREVGFTRTDREVIFSNDWAGKSSKSPSAVPDWRVPDNMPLLTVDIFENSRNALATKTIYGRDIRTRVTTQEKVEKEKGTNLWGQRFTAKKTLVRTQKLILTKGIIPPVLAIAVERDLHNIEFRVCGVAAYIDVEWRTTRAILTQIPKK